MNCKNCEQPAEGKFCAHCGQRTSVDRINFSSLTGELSDILLKVNKGLFYTIKELIVRPGESIRGFIEGKRKYHFKPIAFALTLSTVYFLLSQLFESGTTVGEFLEGFSSGWSKSDKTSNQVSVLIWFVENYAYTVLLLLPLYALASLLAFYRFGYNYFEHIVLNAYITGQQAIFYAFFTLLRYWISDEDFTASAAILVSVCYTFVVFWQFFSKQSRLGVLFRTILTYALSLFFLAIALVIVSIVSGIIT